MPLQLFRCLILLFALGIATPIFAAASKADSDHKTEASEVADPYNRENPRALRLGLLDAMKARDYPRLARYLEIAKPDTKAAADKAFAFKNVLDERGSLLASLQISILPEGALDDGLPPDEEQIGEFEQDGETIAVLAHRTESEGGLKIWRVSKTTLAKIPAGMPAAAAKEEEAEARLLILGAPLKDWLIMLAVALAIYLLTSTVMHGLRFLLGKPLSPKHRERFDSIVDSAVAPFALFIAYLATSRLADTVGTDIVARNSFNKLAGAVGWFALGWFVWRLVGATAELANGRLRAAGHLQSVGFVNFVSRLIRFLLGVLGIAVLLSSFGIDVTSGLAALGVGGLALALGARKLVENFIGSLSVLVDKPVRIGDTCRIDDIVGEVDDIGMRSTRIRTRDRTMLTIPNSKFSECEIENLSLRDGFLVNQRFGIAHDAAPDRVELVLKTLRDCLDTCPHCLSTPSSIRFLGFGEACLSFQIYTRISSASYAEGLMRQEALLLAILKRFAELGIAIALPTRRLELPPQPGADVAAAAVQSPR